MVRTLLSAVLLIAVSAWGQTSKCVGDHCDYGHTYCVPGFHPDAMSVERIGNDYTFQCQQAKPKPHKPKPSVKKDRNRTCISPQDDKNTDCILPNRYQVTVAQGAQTCVADGVGCWTGPVPNHMVQDGVDVCGGVPCAGNEMGHGDNTLPPHECDATPDECWRLRKGIDFDTFYRALKGIETITNQQLGQAPEGNCFRGNLDEKQIPCPDKAAVPVEHVSVSAQILAKDGTLAVMLSDSEYSHLQQLRASVVEEERRLAVRYGAFLRDAKCAAAPVCISMWDDDHYEFHGQFLLIEKRK